VISKNPELATVPTEQVWDVRAWEATALQDGGTLETAVAVTVTPTEGVKPCALPSPEKYAPLSVA
jgi:hypothetical protein